MISELYTYLYPVPFPTFHVSVILQEDLFPAAMILTLTPHRKNVLENCRIIHVAVVLLEGYA
jgi:hypothetical protein